MASSASLTSPISMLLLGLLLFQSCQAEKQVLASVDQQVQKGQLSPAFFGTIHATGSLDFAKLDYAFPNSRDGTVVVASIHFANHGERERLKKWEADDNASFRTRKQEFLASKGIGAVANGAYYLCCTHDAVTAGACDPNWSNSWFQEDYDDHDYFNLSMTGNMIYNSDGDNTRFRVLDINTTVTDLGMHGVMWFEETRLVALFFANCDSTSDLGNGNSTAADDSTVHISGTITWTSFISLSTLPLYIFLSICHGGLCLWYRELMNKNRESRIQVEEWIFFTLFLATAAMGLKTIYFATETLTDDEWANLSFVSEFTKSISRAVSRFLYLMLAMGVGVTAPKLESVRLTIMIAVFLGIYILCDLVEALFIYHIYFPYLGTTLITKFILSIILMIWIPRSIRKTMKHLEFHNETMKLERYQWIWKIYLLAIFLAVAQTVAWIVDVQVNAGRDFDWARQAEVGDIIYLVIIGCMASLWKPNPSQQMYSYVMLGGDGDDYAPTNMSLELSEAQFGSDDEHDLRLS